MGTIKVTATYNASNKYLNSTKTLSMKILPKVKTKLTLKISKSKDKLKITATLKNKSQQSNQKRESICQDRKYTYTKKTKKKETVTIMYVVVKSALGKAIKATITETICIKVVKPVKK